MTSSDVNGEIQMPIGRIPCPEFPPLCSPGHRDLQEALHRAVKRELGRRVKLVCGPASMTANRIPRGELFRAHNASVGAEVLCELDAQFEQLLAERGFVAHGGQIAIPDQPNTAFNDAVIDALKGATRNRP